MCPSAVLSGKPLFAGHGGGRDRDRRGRSRDRSRRSRDRSQSGPRNFGYTYGLSAEFLESLGIDGPLNTKVFVANVSLQNSMYNECSKSGYKPVWFTGNF